MQESDMRFAAQALLATAREASPSGISPAYTWKSVATASR